MIVCVSGGAGHIAYQLVVHLAEEEWAWPLDLRLLDVPASMETLRGHVMELEDCHLRGIRSIVATDIPCLAFEGADLVILLGSNPRKPGQRIPDLLENNVGLFQEHGQMIAQWASSRVRVLVVGNPCNTNAWVCKELAPSVPPSSFTALSRLDLNRSVFFVNLFPSFSFPPPWREPPARNPT